MNIAGNPSYQPISLQRGELFQQRDVVRMDWMQVKGVGVESRPGEERVSKATSVNISRLYFCGCGF